MGRSGVTLIISVALLVLVAESFAAVSYRVNDGTDQDINEFSVCKNVDNASGHDLFVATKSIQEWFAFIAGPPGGTTLTACGATPPDAIADLTYAGRTNASVSLTWTAPADNGTAIIDYLVEYKLTADSTWTVFVDGLSTTTAVTVTGLTASTSYDFRVAALNGSQGAYSNVVTQDTAPNDPFFNPGVYNAMNCGGATTSTVVAMDDNTNIQLNGSTLTGSPINAHAVITFASALGDIISADKPVFVGGSLVLGGGDAGKGNIVWNTPYWAGKDFITVGSRNNPHLLTVYAFENTTINITEGATSHYTNDPVTAGNFKTYSLPNNAGYKITSTGLITAYQYSNSGSTNVVDNLPILPPAIDIIGIPSRTGQYTTIAASAAFNWYESDNTTGGTTLTEGNFASYASNGANFGAPSAHAIGAAGIVGRSNADNDGSDSAPFTPSSFAKRRFVINHDSEWVAFVSLYPAVLQIFPPSGAPSTLTLTRTGSGANTPYFGRLTVQSQGTVIESNLPFQAYYESDENPETGSAREDETIMFGYDGVDLPVNFRLIQWLDASDAATLFQNDDCTGIVTTNGENVGCWRDKSLQGNNATQTGSNKPTFSAGVSGFGGKNGVDFDGGTNYLNFDSSGLIGMSYTIFAVVHRDTTGSNNYFYGTQSGTANQGLHLGFSSDTAARLGQVSNNLDATVVGQAENSVGLIWGRLNGSTGKKVFFNGVTNTDATTTLLSGSGQGVIGRGFDTNGFDGQIAELIVYNRALSDAEVLLVQDYLVNKWLTPGFGTNLRLWLSSLDGSQVFTDAGCSTKVASSGDSVLCWQDNSGRGYQAKSSTGTPLWTADGSRNVIAFTNDSLQISGAGTGAVFPSGATLSEVDIFAVMKSSSSVETGYLLHHPAGNRLSAHVPWSGNAEFDLDAGASGTLSAAWGANTTNYFLWNFTNASGLQSIYRDTNLVTSDATASSLGIGTENFYIGGQSGSSNFQNMNLGSLIIYDKKLTDAERHMVRAYLKIKWGL